MHMDHNIRIERRAGDAAAIRGAGAVNDLVELEAVSGNSMTVVQGNRRRVESEGDGGSCLAGGERYSANRLPVVWGPTTGVEKPRTRRRAAAIPIGDLERSVGAVATESAASGSIDNIGPPTAAQGGRQLNPRRSIGCGTACVVLSAGYADGEVARSAGFVTGGTGIPAGGGRSGADATACSGRSKCGTNADIDSVRPE